MTSLKRQMLEDKATRDAARALIEADVEHVKSLASSPQFKERASSQASDKGSEALKAASKAVDKNKGYLAALAGAVILWLAREPVQALFEKLTDGLGQDESEANNEELATEAEESQ